jgi:hypothetical protein
MKEYLMLMGLLAVVYMGYLVVQAKEKKMMRRYYGYRSRSRSTSAKQLKQAA